MSPVSADSLVSRRFYLAHRRTAGSIGEQAARATIQRHLAKTTEESVAWLIAWRWPRGRQCPMCDEPDAYWLRTYGRWACKRCRVQYTWSSGTALAANKKRSQVYVAAIDCASHRLCSANFFAHEVGMQSSAAVRLFQKIRSESNKEVK